MENINKIMIQTSPVSTEVQVIGYDSVINNDIVVTVGKLFISIDRVIDRDTMEKVNICEVIIRQDKEEAFTGCNVNVNTDQATAVAMLNCGLTEEQFEINQLLAELRISNLLNAMNNPIN